jgi:ADP-heptose:LPS heptosyltransferase
MYRNNQVLEHGHVFNAVLNNGALGDIITSLPALITGRAEHPGLTFRVWAPSWQEHLIRHLLAPYGTFEVLHFEKFPMKQAEREQLNMGMVALNQVAYNTFTRNRTHMVTYAFNCLLDSQPESLAEMNYPTAAPLGPRTIEQKYVVFPVGATSANKLFRASVMSPIIRWVRERGYLPVVVGTKTSHTKAEARGKLTPIVMIDEADRIPMELCLDMREKTTLLELRDLCGHAAAVCGVDGGTIHVAGTTDTNVLYGLTTTLPKHRFVVRNGDMNHKIRYVGPRDLSCSGCQSNWRGSRQDFRFCAYGDSLCTERLHPDDFIAGLEELGL